MAKILTSANSTVEKKYSNSYKVTVYIKKCIYYLT